MAGLAVARLSRESHSWHCLKVEKWHLPRKKPQSEARRGCALGPKGKKHGHRKTVERGAAKQEVIGTLGRTRDTGQHLREVGFVTITFPRALILETYLSPLMGPYHFSYQI